MVSDFRHHRVPVMVSFCWVPTLQSAQTMWQSSTPQQLLLLEQRSLSVPCTHDGLAPGCCKLALSCSLGLYQPFSRLLPGSNTSHPGNEAGPRSQQGAEGTHRALLPLHGRQGKGLNRACKNTSVPLAPIRSGRELALQAGKELRKQRAICWGEVGVHCSRSCCGFPFYPFTSDSQLPS